MEHRQTRALHLTAIILIGYIFFFHGMGNYSLKEPDEGRYAEIPREMIESGNYMVPYLNHVRYFEKPPLFYWTTAMSYKMFGVNEWSFRFPNALSAFLCVMLLYGMTGRWFGERVAYLSSLILISSFGFFAMGRIVTLDMFFTLWCFTALLFFYGYYREKKPLFIYLAYGALGLSTLTKGPVALILAGATVIIFLLTERRLSFLKEMRWVPGLAIYAIITVPWFLSISLKEKEFFNFFFVDQHFLRFFTTKHKRTGSLFYFIPVLLGGMFPWSLLIPRAIANCWKRQEIRLFLIWSIVVFVFFTVSRSKLPPYILPVFPAMSLLLGCLFAEKWGQSTRTASEVIVYMLVFGVFALSALLPLGDSFQLYLNRLSSDATEIYRDLRGFSITLSLISALVLCLFLLPRFRRLSYMFYTLGGFSLALMLLVILNFTVIDKLNTTKRLAAIVRERNVRAEYFVNYGSLEQTFPFYTQQRIILASYTGELEMGSQYPDAQGFFITREEFFRLWGSDADILCLTKMKRVSHVVSIASGKARVLGCQSGRCLISNH